MAAKENRLAEARRLKNIVSSSLDQTATDKRNIAYSIEILQLPHRIEKRNIFIKANPTVKLALFFKAKTDLLEQPFNLRKTLRMPRSQYHPQIRELLFKCDEDFKENLLFTPIRPPNHQK